MRRSEQASTAQPHGRSGTGWRGYVQKWELIGRNRNLSIRRAAIGGAYGQACGPAGHVRHRSVHAHRGAWADASKAWHIDASTRASADALKYVLER
jgi:hypothetical protein